MRSTLAHRATTAALMNRPCLTELLTKTLVIWHYDCAAAAAAVAARGGNSRAAAALAPGTSATNVSATPPSFRGFKSQTSKRYFNHHNKINSISNSNTGLFESDSITTDLYKPSKGIGLQYQVPQRIRQKVISASDAASLVRDGDTVCVTGFVSQGKCCGAM